MDWIAILKVAGVGGGYVVAVIAVVVAWRYQTAAASRIREVETANRALDASGKAYATSLNAAEERRKTDRAEMDAKIALAEARLQDSEDWRHEEEGRHTAAVLVRDQQIDHLRRLVDAYVKKFPGAGGDRLDAAGELLSVEAVPDDSADSDRPAPGAVPQEAAGSGSRDPP